MDDKSNQMGHITLEIIKTIGKMDLEHNMIQMDRLFLKVFGVMINSLKWKHRRSE